MLLIPARLVEVVQGILVRVAVIRVRALDILAKVAVIRVRVLDILAKVIQALDILVNLEEAIIHHSTVDILHSLIHMVAIILDTIKVTNRDILEGINKDIQGDISKDIKGVILLLLPLGNLNLQISWAP